MSVNYSASLSEYPNKGSVGDKEFFDSDEVFTKNIKQLADLVKSSNYIVFHTGAGISTSTGIPDFRGPNGVWTKERRGEKPSFNKKFTEVLPSLTHRALYSLEKKGICKYLITQNVDGIHFRFGFPRDRISILHGDMFIERCEKCYQTYYRVKNTVPTIGLKKTTFKCTRLKSESRPCRGDLVDSVLDWEHDLPNPDYDLARKNSKLADLHICLGTSLQIFPAADFPMENISKGRKRKIDSQQNPKARLVIVNLQKTKLDKYCNIRFFRRVDEVMQNLCELINVDVEPLESFYSQDPSTNQQVPKPVINLTSLNSHERSVYSEMMRHPCEEETIL